MKTIYLHGEIFEFHNCAFALRYFVMSMASPQCDTPLVLCTVKPEAADLLELSETKLSIGPISVKPIAKGFTKCKYLL